MELILNESQLQKSFRVVLREQKYLKNVPFDFAQGVYRVVLKVFPSTSLRVYTMWC